MWPYKRQLDSRTGTLWWKSRKVQWQPTRIAWQIRSCQLQSASNCEYSRLILNFPVTALTTGNGHVKYIEKSWFRQCWDQYHGLYRINYLVSEKHEKGETHIVYTYPFVVRKGETCTHTHVAHAFTVHYKSLTNRPNSVSRMIDSRS